MTFLSLTFICLTFTGRRVPQKECDKNIVDETQTRHCGGGEICVATRTELSSGVGDHSALQRQTGQ